MLDVQHLQDIGNHQDKSEEMRLLDPKLGSKYWQGMKHNLMLLLLLLKYCKFQVHIFQVKLFQMGKSSLRVRVIEKLRHDGIACATLDPQTIGKPMQKNVLPCYEQDSAIFLWYMQQNKYFLYIRKLPISI